MRSLAGLALILALALPGAANASQLFISNEKDNTVTVLDSETMKPVKVIKTGARPRGIRITPDFKWVLVCTGDADAIDVIDTEKLEVVRSIPTLADPEYLEVEPSGKRIFIANEDDAMVTVVEMATGKELAEIAVGIEPEGMAFSPDGAHAVATSES